MEISSNIPSIFNDVLSPVTLGPSSSNTCGPFRLASMCRQLLGEPPLSLAMTMAEDGGYSDTFYSMQSDLASIAGLLGKDFLTYPLRHAYEDAEEEGLTWDFQFSTSIPIYPSEQAKMTIGGKTRTITITGVSWGGGDVEITEINGNPVSLKGKEYVVVIFFKDNSIQICSERITSENAELKQRDAEKDPQVSYAVILSPVHPFCSGKNTPVPFSSAAELLQAARENKTPLWKLALEYESAVTGASKEELLAYADTLYQTALASIKEGLRKNISFEGVTTAKASAYEAALNEGRLIPLGASDKGCLDALSIMEYSNSHGKIVCMPTGGASGIVPAAIKNTAEKMGISYEKQLQALLVAGLTGLFFYPTHYSGAIGCQAEIGIAIAMAAAGLASLMTEEPKTIETAASLGAQSVMGMVCNPIDGYVQVPCIVRNMTAVPTAMVCANAAVSGMDSIIPLDSTVELILEIGKKIRPCNRAGTYITKK